MGLEYTQHTKAFPNVPFYGQTKAVKEELSLSWDWGVEDTGLNGSISLYWHWFGNQHGGWAIQIEMFTDSLELFLRPEVIRLMVWLSERREAEGTPHWDEVLGYLRGLGFTPSSYHQKGLA